MEKLLAGVVVIGLIVWGLSALALPREDPPPGATPPPDPPSASAPPEAPAAPAPDAAPVAPQPVKQAAPVLDLALPKILDAHKEKRRHAEVHDEDWMP